MSSLILFTLSAICLSTRIFEAARPSVCPLIFFSAHDRSQPELSDSRPYHRLIIGHGNDHHGHRVAKSLVHAVHAVMRDEQVSPLKDRQLVYRLVDEYILRNPPQLCLVEITANQQHHRDISVPNASTTA